MSGKIMKQLVISMILISSWTNLKAAHEPNKVNFDPFATEVNSVPKDNKSTSGPLIPQVEFNNNDISMAFQIISDATGWSIFPTADVSKAKINLWVKNISAQQLLDKVITMAGFISHRDGDVITVMTYEEYMEHQGLAKRVIKLKFANATSVEATVKPFLTKLGKSVVHKETNTIVLYETDANLKFIEAVIEKLDSPTENIILEVINIKYADCENLSKILQSIFSNQKKEQRNKGTITAADSNGIDKLSVNLADDSTEIYAVTHTNQLVIVGTATNIKKVKCLVSKVDVFNDNMVLEVIDLKYADSELLAEKLQKLFTEEKSKGQTAKNDEHIIETSDSKIMPVQYQATPANNILSPLSEVYIQALGRTNQLVLKAYRADIERLRELISKLDSFVEPVTQNYQLTYIDASEIVTGLEKILNLDTSNTSSRENQSKNNGITLIEKTNSILLTGPPSVHRIMASIVEKVDKPGTYETGMTRIYKLENANVDEVAKIISDLLEVDSAKNNNSSSKAGLSQKVTPSLSAQTATTSAQTTTSSAQTATTSAQTAASTSFAKSEEFVPQIKASVSVSKATNSIVIQATARQHRELEKLIKELDIRPKQVLIEAMIVELTTTDNLSLGMELSHVIGKMLAFSDFGLSTNLDPTTGNRNITVSPGGAAAILQPDKLGAIIKALKQNGNVRITSAPRILVNDNGVGSINSIAEEPTVQTNQGTTSTTTSFAGFVDAGTQFAITPHISKNNYLSIEYQITLNSFGTKSSDPSIPPPRNTSSIQSQATVPDGYTIVVGGIQSTDKEENVDKVPILGDVPILGHAFKNTTSKKQYKTTYLFITPNIMGNENFADLKGVSKKALNEIEPNSPPKKQEDVNNINDE